MQAVCRWACGFREKRGYVLWPCGRHHLAFFQKKIFTRKVTFVAFIKSGDYMSLWFACKRKPALTLLFQKNKSSYVTNVWPYTGATQLKLNKTEAYIQKQRAGQQYYYQQMYVPLISSRFIGTAFYQLLV